MPEEATPAQPAPAPPGIIPAEAVYVDERGRIAALPHFATAGAMVIESVAGAVRGNHYHLNESHLMYVVSGLMLYLEQDPDDRLTITEVAPGQSVISPPGAPHCTVFPEQTVFVTLSDWDRRGHRYEDEVVRVAPMEERPEFADRLRGVGPLVTGPLRQRRGAS